MCIAGLAPNSAFYEVRPGVSECNVDTVFQFDFEIQDVWAFTSKNDYFLLVQLFKDLGPQLFTFANNSLKESENIGLELDLPTLRIEKVQLSNLIVQISDYNGFYKVTLIDLLLRQQVASVSLQQIYGKFEITAIENQILMLL